MGTFVALVLATDPASPEPDKCQVDRAIVHGGCVQADPAAVHLLDYNHDTSLLHYVKIVGGELTAP